MAGFDYFILCLCHLKTHSVDAIIKRRWQRTLYARSTGGAAATGERGSIRTETCSSATILNIFQTDWPSNTIRRLPTWTIPHRLIKTQTFSTKNIQKSQNRFRTQRPVVTLHIQSITLHVTFCLPPNNAYCKPIPFEPQNLGVSVYRQDSVDKRRYASKL